MERTPLIALFAAAACAPAPVHLSSEGLSFDAAFFLALDGDGAIVRISPAFGIEGGRISYGQAAIELDGAEKSAVLVTLDSTLIQSTVSGFELGRLAEVALELDT